jgi:hypothetical protein
VLRALFSACEIVLSYWSIVGNCALKFWSVKRPPVTP